MGRSNRDVGRSKQGCSNLGALKPQFTRKTESYFPDGKIYLSLMGFFLSPFDSRSVNRAVSNVEGLKLKITAHKTFKNKFDQIRAGIKFIYICDRLQRILTANLERVLFFTLQCKRMYFQSTKLTNILFWRDIRALICVYNRIGRTQLGNYLFSDSKVSGTIARKTDNLHVHVFCLRPICAINFSRDQSSAKLINFLDSRIDTRDSILKIIKDRVSSLEDRGSRDCQLTFERYCT